MNPNSKSTDITWLLKQDYCIHCGAQEDGTTPLSGSIDYSTVHTPSCPNNPVRLDQIQEYGWQKWKNGYKMVEAPPAPPATGGSYEWNENGYKMWKPSVLDTTSSNSVKSRY